MWRLSVFAIFSTAVMIIITPAALADSINGLQIFEQFGIPLIEHGIQAQQQAAAEARHREAVDHERERQYRLSQTPAGRRQLRKEKQIAEQRQRQRDQAANAMAGLILRGLMSGGSSSGGRTDCSFNSSCDTYRFDEWQSHQH